jgi:hypothetical protein
MTAQHPNINPSIHPSIQSITVPPVAVDSLWPNSSLCGGVLVAVGSLWATLTQILQVQYSFSTTPARTLYHNKIQSLCVCV